MTKIKIIQTIFFLLLASNICAEEKTTAVIKELLRPNESTILNDNSIFSKEEKQPKAKDKSLALNEEMEIRQETSPEIIILQNGINNFQNNNLFRAKKNFSNIIKNFPNSPYSDQAYLWLAKIEFRNKNYKESKKQLKKINNMSGEYPVAQFLLAKNFYAEKNYGAAADFFNSIQMLYPEHSICDDSLLELSKCYLHLEQIDMAQQALLKIIKNYKQTENIDDAWFYLGKSFEENNELDNALKTYRIFMEKSKKKENKFFYNSPLKEEIIKKEQRIEELHKDI